MNHEARTAVDVVHGHDLCIRDPGGDDRAHIPTTDADHSPPADPDGTDEMLAPVSEALFDAVDLRPGQTVLDIGCGSGATTLAAATAVDPGGSVHGVDLTAAMLDIARARLAASGLSNVSLVEGDVQADPLPRGVDVAISRFGTMFFDDPIAAFTNVREALRSGGRLCVATWQPLDANAWLVIPGAALLAWITLPDLDGDGPGMFSQSDPATVTATLDAAGWTDIDVTPTKLALPMGRDATHAAARLSDTGVGRAALDAVPAEQRPAALESVRDALALHCTDDGVHLGAAVLITTATAP